MSLDKYKGFLVQLSVKQLVILINTNFIWSENLWCVKNLLLMLLVANLGIFEILQELS